MRKKKNFNAEKIMIRLWKAAVIVQCLMCSMTVHATSLESTTLVTGIKNLAADAGKVLLVVETAVVAVLEVATGLKYQFGEEDEKPKQIKSAKRIAAVGALIFTASSVLTVIFSYFQ